MKIFKVQTARRSNDFDECYMLYISNLSMQWVSDCQCKTWSGVCVCVSMILRYFLGLFTTHFDIFQQMKLWISILENGSTRRVMMAFHKLLKDLLVHFKFNLNGSHSKIYMSNFTLSLLGILPTIREITWVCSLYENP